MNTTKSHQSGFSLLELLTIVVIVGLLASAVFFAVSSARASSRDKKRIADFKQFEVALEVFFNEYGVYPCGEAVHDGWASIDSSGDGQFLDGPRGNNGTGCLLGPGHEPWYGLYTAGLLADQDPRDPLNNAPEQSYWYAVNGLSSSRNFYLLYVHLEKDTERMKNDGGLCPDVYEVGPGVGVLPPGNEVPCGALLPPPPPPCVPYCNL